MEQDFTYFCLDNKLVEIVLLEVQGRVDDDIPGVLVNTEGIFVKFICCLKIVKKSIILYKYTGTLAISIKKNCV